jgi:hypothetical protein
MNNFSKKISKMACLFLLALTLNKKTTAMNQPQAPQPFVIQVQQLPQPSKLSKAWNITKACASKTGSALKWSATFPLNKAYQTATHYLESITHLLNGNKEVILGTIEMAQLIAFLYGLDCLLYYIAPCFPTTVLPIAAQNVIAKVAQSYNFGNLSAYINNLLSRKYFAATV